MNFVITITKDIFHIQEDKKEIEEYKKLGFSFIPATEYFSNSEIIKYEDFVYRDTENVNIELSTLEELVEFTKKYGEIIVNGQSIEIYNDWRE